MGERIMEIQRKTSNNRHKTIIKGLKDEMIEKLVYIIKKKFGTNAKIDLNGEKAEVVFNGDLRVS